MRAFSGKVAMGPGWGVGGLVDRCGGPAGMPAGPPVGCRGLLLGEEHVGVVAPVRVQEIGHRVTVVAPGEVLVRPVADVGDVVAHVAKGDDGSNWGMVGKDTAQNETTIAANCSTLVAGGQRLPAL